MSAEVMAVMHIATKDYKSLKAVKDAIEPDNAKTPPEMKIEDYLEVSPTGEYKFSIKVKVHGDLQMALKKARSTVDEILAIVKVLNETLEQVIENSQSVNV